MGEMRCRRCERSPRVTDCIIVRLNEKGVPGAWVCTDCVPVEIAAAEARAEQAERDHLVALIAHGKDIKWWAEESKRQRAIIEGLRAMHIHKQDEDGCEVCATFRKALAAPPAEPKEPA